MDKRLAFHAERFGLVVVDPEEFLIERRPRGRGHTICFTAGDRPMTEEIKKRIKALGIPPAWRDVRICLEENGHIQAIGRDEKDRVQYRYHTDWLNVRNAVKTERLLRFGKSLPRLRKRISRDMRRKEVDRRAASATAARLVDIAAMRPGHEKYAEDGGRGVASLTKGDIRLAGNGNGGQLKFMGKSSKLNEIAISDRRLLGSIGRIRKLKGKRLFSFKETGAKRRNLTAPVLNEYLREAAESKISAKDFRTFHGSAEALRFLIDEVGGTADTEPKRKRAVAAAMRSVSERLRNTPAVARASYVHPEIVTAFEEQRLDPALLRGRERDGLNRVETGLMRFLEEVATN
ncbi:DNA topoisomerase IB [Aureimonas leprariae]|uniref:DNA topoisomerase n=1 Tax=Plantimonas leprariae TaxID=2615207 RepID=A0A7V7U1S4_9HYPH|nr:DNA topoisomerase IB [Aureimonas leprariae]KAB0682598.1 DNA topoisomerase IB [Aureimonas leprariae]